MTAVLKKTAALLWLVVAPAYAQEQVTKFDFSKVAGDWTAGSGVVVTAGGRTFAMQTIALEIGYQALAAGTDPIAATRWSEEFVASGKMLRTPNALVAGSGGGAMIALHPATTLKIDEILQPNVVSLRLWKMPRVKIMVVPTPPRDYAISINGEVVVVTERGEYGVAPGFVRVRVTRDGKQDCVWEGELAEGAEHPLRCTM